jgi:hypothetical protein
VWLSLCRASPKDSFLENKHNSQVYPSIARGTFAKTPGDGMTVALDDWAKAVGAGESARQLLQKK